MLQEYAIDPRVAANSQNLKLISALFDYSNPRRISRFSRAWARMVHAEAGKFDSDLNKTRVEVLLRQLKDQNNCIFGFNRAYDPEKTWPDNAVESHQNRQFHGIVSDEGRADFISSDDIGDAHPDFQHTAPFHILKSLQNLITVISPLIDHAKYIYIVDPYFSPYNPLCQQLFNEIFIGLNTRADANTVKIKICTSSDRYRGPYGAGEEARFLSDMNVTFNLGDLAANTSVHLMPHGGDMHSRYMLTDIASLIFDHSFSVDDTSTVNISMMSKDIADSARLDFFGET